MSITQLAVFSGECHMGNCGEETGFKDWRGNPLFVGDIVMIFTVRVGGEDFEHLPDYLSAVVKDEDGPFVMGIKSVPMDELGNWRVMRVKSHKEVVTGEHWNAWGFSYRQATP